MIRQGVSFYSYQTLYRAGQITLEQMVAEVKALGCDGIELLPTQTKICSYPIATGAEMDAWHELMAKYETRPTCFDTVLFPVSGEYDDQMEQMKQELRLCHQLGFTIMRIPIGPFGRGLRQDVVEDCLGMAEDLNINLGQEIHAPFTISGQRVQSHLDFIARKNTKFASLIPDMAIFATVLPARLSRKTLALGGEPTLVQAIEDAFAQRVDMDAFAARLRAEHPNMSRAADDMLTHAVNNTPSTVAELRDILPHVSHFHGKFYEISETLTDETIRWDEVIPLLSQSGWDGYINSEYEGQRMYLPDEPSDELEQVRRQHRMVSHLIP